MKKTFNLRIPVIGFIISGVFLLSAMDALVAQQTLVQGDDLYAESKGPFMSPAAARAQLDIEIVPIKYELAGLVEGTTAHKNLTAKYVYFNTIQNMLIEGKSVSRAIVDALRVVGADNYGISHQLLLTYKNEVIGILKV